MATQDYYTIKNAALITPTTATDLGSVSQPYGNLYLQGNVTLGSTTLTSTNAITPKISTITYPGTETATDTAGGETITLTGSGFTNGCSILVGSTTVSVVGFVSSNVVTFTAPVMAAGSYTLYVINPDGGTAISIPGINYSGTPTWSTASGSLGSGYEGSSISATFAATGDAPITYVLSSGTLPAGSTLSSSGSLSGTASTVSVSTTYNFTIAAKDAQNQPTNRNFSLTINPDTVSWVSPADNTTTNLASSELMANITMSATSAASGTIAYTANALPTGLTITGANIAGTPTGSGSSSSLITATSSPSGKTATRTFNWVVTVTNETYWPYVSLLINGEGSASTNNATNNVFVESVNNYTVTKTNTPTQGTFSPYSQGSWSNYFDGNSYITVPTSTGLNFGSGSYTIEGWFNLNLPIVAQYTIFGLETGWKITVISTGLRLWADDAQTYQTATATINPYTWYHFAWVRESTSLGKLYLNGTLITTITSGTIVSNAVSGQIAYIGRYNSGISNQFTGNISNLRVVKGTSVYTSDFTPSTTPLTAISGTSLLTCQTNQFKDSSTTNATLTTVGAVKVDKYSPFNGTAVYTPATHGGSMYLKGANGTTGDCLTISNISSLGTGDFTIECWTYLDTTGFINGGAVFGLFNNADSMQMLLRPENDVFWRFYATSSNTIDLASQPPFFERWIHHAMVRISGTTKYYQNGVLKGSTADTFNYDGTVLKVGTYANYNMKGYISDFRIVKGTGVYTSAFTPPTQALTAIANTTVLLSFTNSGIIDQTGMNNLATVGDTKIVTADKKFGTGSIYFDGTGDSLTTPINSNFKFRTGNFTVEFWLKGTTVRTATLVGCNGSAATGYWMGVFVRNANPAATLFYWQSAYALTNAFYVDLTAWGKNPYDGSFHHIAITRENGSLRFFYDGVQATTMNASSSTVSDSTDYNPTTGNLTIGNSADYDPLVGYMDDLRITKGYARYTSTFTPPTSTFVTR